MRKKPNISPNFILSIFLILITHSLLGQEGNINSKVIEADSLFLQQKYMESFELYEEIILESGQSSPRMLMKMAFIKEGLGDYSQALLYLNKYYLATADKKATAKMEELAEEHELAGYSTSDKDFFISIMNKYYLVLNITVFAAAMLLLSIILYRKIKKQANIIPYSIILFILLGALFLTINIPLKPRQVIVVEDHAYLMTGPSAGADLVEVIKKGHRLELLDTNEPWAKVHWEDQEVYIKNNMVKDAI